MASTTVIVKNGDRMMTTANPVERGIELAFADGRSGLIPFADLPEIENLADLTSLEIPNPFELLITNARGEQNEIPWDFARHYCDVSYQPRIESVAARGRAALGAKIKQTREARGLTQQELATLTGINRVTLSRLEAGRQSPRLDTLNTLAKSLNLPVEELVASSATADRA
jgi:DNA-binding XRE family transcriptional regulator